MFIRAGQAGEHVCGAGVGAGGGGGLGYRGPGGPDCAGGGAAGVGAGDQHKLLQHSRPHWPHQVSRRKTEVITDGGTQPQLSKPKTNTVIFPPKCPLLHTGLYLPFLKVLSFWRMESSLKGWSHCHVKSEIFNREDDNLNKSAVRSRSLMTK